MTPREILMKARHLISARKRWCQGEYARFDDGERCEPDHPGAVCWCAFGAVRHFDGNGEGDLGAASLMLGDASSELFDKSANSVNDCEGHEPVMRMFDLAIQIARTDEAREVSHYA